jgi:hypothetical protein
MKLGSKKNAETVRDLRFKYFIENYSTLNTIGKLYFTPTALPL